MSEAKENRVLIIAPVGQDAEALAAVLRAKEIPSEICQDPAECLKQTGTGAGALLLTEEALEMASADELLAQFGSQPAWSELPLIILTSGGESRLVTLLDLAASTAGSATLLERPMSSTTLLRSVQVALRSRRRQYQVRDLMAEQERQRRELEDSITERKKAEATLRRDLEALNRMHELSLRRFEAGGQDALLQQIMEAAVTIVGAEKGTLQLLEGEVLRIVAQHGQTPEFLQYFAAAQTRASVCGEATRRGDRVLVPDVETSPLFADTSSLEVLRAAGVRAVQSTPIISRNGVLLGMLSTHWGKPYSPDEHDLWRIDLLVRQAADLIEKTRAEAVLRESEERFRSLADGTPLLIWVHDLEGGLRFVNRAWSEFFGKTLDQVSGENWKPLLHADDVAGYEHEFLRCNAERREFHGQARVRRHDGQCRWLESFAAPRFSGTGEYLGMAGSSVDITERKEAEAVLARDRDELERLVGERTAKLQELVGELEHFSYSITHDMRAPLRAMMAFAQMLEEMCANSPNQEQKEFVRRIGVAARRMDLLITDALNYSKAVRSELPLAPVDVGRLVRGMLDTYPELQVARQRIRVERDLPLVMGNEAGLTQCFSNLLANAVKFVKPGDSPDIQVRAEQRDGWVRLWVEDKGIGISEALRPRIFSMFARGASAQAGTGIGLALVRKVVNRMGGRVGVESEEGNGSRFWVELKIGDVRQARAGAAGSTPGAQQRDPS